MQLVASQVAWYNPYAMVRSKAKITSKGQITLPATVRKALGVDRGDDIVFIEHAGRITVAPAVEPNRFAKFAGKYRTGSGRTRAQSVEFVRSLRGRGKR